LRDEGVRNQEVLIVLHNAPLSPRGVAVLLVVACGMNGLGIVVRFPGGKNYF
jgi:hypothetical protein